MKIRALIRNVGAKFSQFARAENGNTVIIFAASLVPLLGLTGAAIDYSRASAIRTAMQSAADATALAISKNASTLTAAQIQSQADTYFRASFTRKDATITTVTATYTTAAGNQVVINASATLDTSIMGVVGTLVNRPDFSQMQLGASSTTLWGNSRLRVALVLDNTGSMSQSGKLTALKTATNNLLSQLQGAATNNGDVYVSIIPFVKDIAVDPINYTANWIDWTDWDASNGSCKNYKNWPWHGSPKDKATCLAYSGTWTSANHNTWNGCITDRGNSTGPDTAGNYDTNVTAPSTTITATLFPAEQYGSCPLDAMPLNYNWSSMTSYVNSMVANGSTNQNIGLVHGWQSLVGGGPYPSPPAMDPNYQYQQVIILLTDGLNTQDRWYGNGSSTSTQVDARQQITCDNINAAGITLYAVQVNTDGSPTSTLLQNCAGAPKKYPDPSKFFLLTSASEIVTTFQQIGTKLSQLRVAK